MAGAGTPASAQKNSREAEGSASRLVVASRRGRSLLLLSGLLRRGLLGGLLWSGLLHSGLLWSGLLRGGLLWCGLLWCRLFGCLFLGHGNSSFSEFLVWCSTAATGQNAVEQFHGCLILPDSPTLESRVFS